jgi:hypothetical protein
MLIIDDDCIDMDNENVMDYWINSDIDTPSENTTNDSSSSDE